MKRVFLLLALACGDGSEDGCVFDGTYEFGGISSNGCAAYSQRLVFYDEEDECSTAIDQLGLSGAIQRGVITCEPGDPVVECSGFMGDSNGCSYDLYVRRVVP